MNNTLKLAYVINSAGIVIKINGYTYRVMKADNPKGYEVLKDILKETATTILEQIELRKISAQVDIGANIKDTLDVQIKKTVNPSYEITKLRQERDNAAKFEYNNRKKTAVAQVQELASRTVNAPYDATKPLSQQPAAKALVDEYHALFGTRAVTAETYHKNASAPRRYEKIFGGYNAFKLTALDSTLV